MKIESKRNGYYMEVVISCENTRINLGLLNQEQLDSLGIELAESLWALGPNQNDECKAWIVSLFNKIGISLERGDK